MATSSIHIEAGKIGFFSHNSRERKTENAIFFDEENFVSCDNKTAIQNFKSELAARTEKYTQRTKQKLNKKTITHLSAIVNFNEHHQPEDIKKVCDYLESEFDTKVIQYAMHRDEGHISESGEQVKNYHAHIEFLGLDSQGNSVRRKLDKKALINLQSKVAELLEMDRGINYTAEKKKRPKRLGTYEYKKVKADETKNVLAKQKDLKEEIASLKKELQGNNALREDYARLEQLNRDLKELVKNKDLTIEQLNAKIDNFSQEFTKKDEKIQDLENTIKEISEHTQKLQDEIDHHKTNPKIITKEVEKIVEVENTIKIDQLRNQNKALEDDKRVLTSKVTDLEDKINSRPNIVAENVDYKEKYNKLATSYNDLYNNYVEIPNAPKKTTYKKFFDVLNRKYENSEIKFEPDNVFEFYTSIVKSYNDLKVKLTNLSKENESLKAENESLKRQISTYQSANDLSRLVNDLEVSEAERHIQEHLDNLENKNVLRNDLYYDLHLSYQDNYTNKELLNMALEKGLNIDDYVKDDSLKSGSYQGYKL